MQTKDFQKGLTPPPAPITAQDGRTCRQCREEMTLPVRMSQWEWVRSRKREPKTLTDVAEKNLRIKRVKMRTSTSATMHKNYFSSNFLLVLKQTFSPSPQDVFAHSHFCCHHLPLVGRPGCGVALGQVFLQVLLSCPVRFIPPKLYSNISFIDHR